MDRKDFDNTLRELIARVVLSKDNEFGDRRPVKSSFLVAVSGGVDSMTLADLCLHYNSGVSFDSCSDHGTGCDGGLYPIGGRSTGPRLRMVVAHCNFHLRGEESDGDEALVRDWCSASGVEVHVADFDTESYAGAHGLSIEMAARELRYGWFARLCRECGLDGVMVAHNANDNAETLMLNLLRGTGLRGLCGMKPVSTVPADNTVPLLRPLLTFTRYEIEDYARANGVKWREDSSNRSSDYRRNRLRNEVFPLFAKINPSFVKTLNREMRHFSEANAIIEEAVPDLIIKGVPASDAIHAVLCERTGDRIDIRELLARRHWPYLLYICLQPYGFSGAVVDDIERFIRRSCISDNGVQTIKMQAGKVFLSDTYILHTTSEGLVLEPVPREGATFIELTVSGPGNYDVGGKSVTLEIVDRNEIESLKAPDGTLYMDAEKIPFPFTIRGWKHGDWIRPFGMGGRKKKVSDLFTDLKYDVVRKARALFIERLETRRAGNDADGAHVCALLGKRIDDAVKVTPSTTKVLIITLSQILH